MELGYGPVGPWGSEKGTTWTDEVYSDIKTIVIRHAAVIDAIQLSGYAFSPESHSHHSDEEYRVCGPQHGGNGGSATTIELGKDEYLEVVRGSFGVVQPYGDVVTSLEFTTSKGRKFGPYGYPSGTPFETQVRAKIVGFFGRSGNYVNQLGVYYLKLIPLKSCPPQPPSTTCPPPVSKPPPCPPPVPTNNNNFFNQPFEVSRPLCLERLRWEYFVRRFPKWGEYECGLDALTKKPISCHHDFHISKDGLSGSVPSALNYQTDVLLKIFFDTQELIENACTPRLIDTAQYDTLVNKGQETVLHIQSLENTITQWLRELKDQQGNVDWSSEFGRLATLIKNIGVAGSSGLEEKINEQTELIKTLQTQLGALTGDQSVKHEIQDGFEDIKTLIKNIPDVDTSEIQEKLKRVEDKVKTLQNANLSGIERRLTGIEAELKKPRPGPSPVQCKFQKRDIEDLQAHIKDDTEEIKNLITKITPSGLLNR